MYEYDDKEEEEEEKIFKTPHVFDRAYLLTSNHFMQSITFDSVRTDSS